MHLMRRKLAAFYFHLLIDSFLGVFGFFKVQVRGATTLPQLQQNLLGDREVMQMNKAPTGWGEHISRSRIQMSGNKIDVLWATSSPGKHNGKFIEGSVVTPDLAIKRLPEEFQLLKMQKLT